MTRGNGRLRGRFEALGIEQALSLAPTALDRRCVEALHLVAGPPEGLHHQGAVEALVRRGGADGGEQGGLAGVDRPGVAGDHQVVAPFQRLEPGPLAADRILRHVVRRAGHPADPVEADQV